ncbi:MAG: DsbA family protein [Nocardioides sp.]
MTKARSGNRAQHAADLLAEQQRLERRRRVVAIASVFAVLALLVGLTWWGISRDTSGELATVSPTGVTDEYGVLVGQASAATTITLYEDFQCPLCRDFETAAGPQLQAAIDAGEVRVDLRIVSFLDRASANEFSSRAANAAFAVLDTAGTEVFKKFHSLLFANQPAEGSAGPTDEELIGYAVEAGAVEADVRGPIEDKIFEQWVVNATDQMSKNGVNGTPTGLIDGNRTGEGLPELIDAVLAAVSQ